MASLVDNAVFFAKSPGIGPFVVASAATGYQTPAQAGATDGKQYRYRAQSADSSQWEEGTGVASATASVLSRSVYASSAGGAAVVNFTLAPIIMLTMFARDVLQFDDPMALSPAQQLQGRSNVGLDQVSNTSDASKPVSSLTQAALNTKLTGVSATAYASLNAAVAAIGATPTTLFVNSVLPLTGNVTVPSTIDLVITKAGTITTAGFTTTINGGFSAPASQVFSGPTAAGDVVFGGFSTQIIRPEWFYSGAGSYQSAMTVAFGATTLGSGQYVALNQLYTVGDGGFSCKAGTGVIGANPQYCGLYATGTTINTQLVVFSGISALNTLNGCFARDFAILSATAVAGRIGLYTAFLVNFNADNIVVENCTTQVYYSGVGSSEFRRIQAGYTLNNNGTAYGFRSDGGNANASVRFINCSAFGNYGMLNTGGLFYGAHITGVNNRDCKFADFETSIVWEGVHYVSNGSLDTDIVFTDPIHDTYQSAGFNISGVGPNGSFRIGRGWYAPRETLAATVAVKIANSFNVTVEGGAYSTYVAQQPYQTHVQGTNCTNCKVLGADMVSGLYSAYFTGGSNNSVLDNNITSMPTQSTVTVSIASPGAITWPASGFSPNQAFTLTTDGALPTGLTPATVYYTKVVTGDTFTFSAAPGGVAIITTGTQSGNHTGYTRPVPTATAHIYMNSTGGTVAGNTLGGFATNGIYIAAGSIGVALGVNPTDLTNITTAVTDLGTGTTRVVSGPTTNTDGNIPLWDGAASSKLKNGLAPTALGTALIGAINKTANGILLGNAAADFGVTAAMIDGQVLVGQTASAPLPKTVTGDWTMSAAGAATLATINGSVGTFGSATQAPQITVNAKGLQTNVANVIITPAVGNITGLGIGIAAALGVNIGIAGAPVVNGGALGTPSSGVATNLTGIAAGLTAGNVSTNANMIGDVTSVGNATTLTNASVIAKLLTGYVAGAGTITAADSILTAIQKNAGNDALKQPLLPVAVTAYVPTFGVGTSGSFTSTTNTAAYLDVGPLRYYMFNFTINTISAPSGYLSITLPGGASIVRDVDQTIGRNTSTNAPLALFGFAGGAVYRLVNFNTGAFPAVAGDTLSAQFVTSRV